MMNRIGFGFDTHRLEEWKEFWLGGVLIPHTKGAVGYSDADVLIHAICDALFGAAALRDIGFHFPDTSQEYKGIDSKIFLERCCSLVREKGFTIVNLDTTIVLQSPKISDYIPEMIRILTDFMKISPDQLSIKAKTSERLGFIGREEGISAYAVALIQVTGD
ncbi:MAG: 2-C-methyl-D-erythritol 2,4-cyclodiphosphate synthase [bacterium]